MSSCQTIRIGGRSKASSDWSTHGSSMITRLACMDMKVSHSAMGVNVVVMVGRPSTQLLHRYVVVEAVVSGSS